MAGHVSAKAVWHLLGNELTPCEAQRLAGNGLLQRSGGRFHLPLGRPNVSAQPVQHPDADVLEVGLDQLLSGTSR